MRISNNTNVNITKLNFCAGHTKLYTDFDGTYFPFPQDAIIERDSGCISQLNKMYSSFAQFSKLAKDKLSILITTGRSKLEMYGVLNDFKESKVDINLPDGYIFRDGLEEVKNCENGSLNDVSSSHFFSQKEDIKQIIKSIDSEITIIEPIANKWINGRGNETLSVLFEKLSPSKRQKYASVVAEDNGILELAFPSNVDTEPFVFAFKKYYEAINAPVDIKAYKNDKNLQVPQQLDATAKGYTYKPSNSIFIRPKTDGIKTDKLIKPKKEVKEIVENNLNDLVIVAGDASNDITMLNPLNYIDIFGVLYDKNAPIEQLLENKDVLNALNKLPLVSIIAGDNSCMKQLLKIKEILDKKGIRKIFVAKNPSTDFLNRIKLGMLVYSDENNQYKYNLGYNLYKEILE